MFKKYELPWVVIDSRCALLRLQNLGRYSTNWPMLRRSLLFCHFEFGRVTTKEIANSVMSVSRSTPQGDTTRQWRLVMNREVETYCKDDSRGFNTRCNATVEASPTPPKDIRPGSGGLPWWERLRPNVTNVKLWCEPRPPEETSLQWRFVKFREVETIGMMARGGLVLKTRSNAIRRHSQRDKIWQWRLVRCSDEKFPKTKDQWHLTGI